MANVFSEFYYKLILQSVVLNGWKSEIKAGLWYLDLREGR